MIGFLKLPFAARHALVTGIVFGALGWNISARAAIIESSQMQNYIEWDVSGRYGGFANQWGSAFGGAGDYSHSFFGQTSTHISAMSYDVTTRLDSNGNFFFLHNAMCIGSCYLSIDTQITFTLFNDSPNPANYRFDSQITPGHLARQNFGSGPVEANFNFTLIDGAPTRPFAFQMTGEAAINRSIYSTNDPTYLVTMGNPNFALNSPRAQTSGGAEVFDGGAAPNWNTLDWGATNIAIDLKPLYGYETRKFYYVLSTFIRMENPCTDIASCAGLQVAFGDPRNDGSVEELSARFSDLASSGTDGQYSSLAGANIPYNPVVGLKFDPFQTTIDLTPQSVPDIRPDPVVPQIVYSGVYVPPPPGVPEPAAWAMLITGFGLVGAMLRRQRQVCIA